MDNIQSSKNVATINHQPYIFNEFIHALFFVATYHPAPCFLIVAYSHIALLISILRLTVFHIRF